MENQGHEESAFRTDGIAKEPGLHESGSRVDQINESRQAGQARGD